MYFLKKLNMAEGPDEIKKLFAQYYKYLDSIQDKMPISAYNFAKAPWHYDNQDSRCPHDSWVETLSINEQAKGVRSEIRSIEIKITLLGAFHDGYIELTYKNVFRYDLSKPLDEKNSHGDWHIDELKLSEDLNVVHDIFFHGGAHWMIECEDIIYEWKDKKHVEL